MFFDSIFVGYFGVDLQFRLLLVSCVLLLVCFLFVVLVFGCWFVYCSPKDEDSFFLFEGWVFFLRVFSIWGFGFLSLLLFSRKIYVVWTLYLIFISTTRKGGEAGCIVVI